MLCKVLAFLLVSTFGVAHAAAPTGDCALVGSSSGVAPFTVQVDYTAVRGGTQLGDVLYKTNFGDPDAGNWSYGVDTSMSKNFSTSMVPVHVYETPGRYTITCLSSNPSGTHSNTVAITVTDPESVFSGTKTICFSNTTTGSGCPAGATETHVTGAAAWNTAISACIAHRPPTRCLFKRGDTYNTNASTPGFGRAGDIVLGAYGSGALPKVQSTSTRGIIISIGDTRVSGLRIMDLEITGIGDATDNAICVSLNSGSAPTNTLMLRVNCHHIGAGVINESGSGYNGGAIQDSSFTNIMHSVGIFGWFRNFGILGNNVGPIRGSSGVFGMRLQPIQKVTVSNNTLTYAQQRPLLAIRAVENSLNAGVCWGGVGECNVNYPAGTPALADTYYFYVSDNKLNAGGNNQLFQIAPAGSKQNNWIYDGIVERNWMAMDNVKDGLYIHGKRITIRNNLCDASLKTNSRTRVRCFLVAPGDATGHVPDPTDNRILNNTCYSAGPSMDFNCVLLDAGIQNVTNTTVENNLAYAPYTPTADPAPLLLHIENGAGTVTGTVGAAGTRGNSSNSQVRNNNPSFDAVDSPPFGYRISTGSYAIDLNTSITQYPAFDFGLCANNAGHIASGAFNPRAQSQCIGAGGTMMRKAK